MTILMLLNANYPDDIRVTKEASALAGCGHRVILLCVARKDEELNETVNGIEVVRLKTGNHLYIRAFWDIMMAIGKHPAFLKGIKRICKKEKVDAIHIHDLPLVSTALIYKKKNPEVKVIADLHENYPEGLKIWHKWKTSPVVKLKNNLFMSFDRWYQIEKKAVQQSDRVIAVVEEMKDKLVRNHGVNPNKIRVITNSESKDFIKMVDNPAIYNNSKDFIITYCGGIGPHRGVDTAVESFVNLKEYKNIKLVIAGFGSGAVMNYIKSLISEYDLRDTIEMLGYQPFSKFYSYMKYADINIIPHQKSGHTDNTVPHKLFQSMMTGKPVLVSSVDPLKRIVSETNAGAIFKAGDPKDLSDKILALYNNEGLRKKYGENGEKATLEGDLNWEFTGKSLCEFYDNLA